MAVQRRIQCPICGYRVFRFYPQDELKLFDNEIGGRGRCEWIEVAPESADIAEVESIVKSVGMRLMWQRRRLESSEE